MTMLLGVNPLEHDLVPGDPTYNKS
jgi:hypothetical protein